MLSLPLTTFQNEIVNRGEKTGPLVPLDQKGFKPMSSLAHCSEIGLSPATCSTWVNLQGGKCIEQASSNGFPHNSNEMWLCLLSCVLAGGSKCSSVTCSSLFQRQRALKALSRSPVDVFLCSKNHGKITFIWGKYVLINYKTPTVD